MNQHPLSKIFRHFFASKRFNEQNGIKIRRPRNYSSYAANSMLAGFKNNSLLRTTVFGKIKNIQGLVILDSGASSHFLLTEAPVSYSIEHNLIKIRLPDGSQVQSLYTAELNNSDLPNAARACHIVPGLTSRSLISVVKLCDAGCEVTFTKFGTGVKVRYRNHLSWPGKSIQEQTYGWYHRNQHHLLTLVLLPCQIHHTRQTLSHLKDQELKHYVSIQTKFSSRLTQLELPWNLSITKWMIL